MTEHLKNSEFTALDIERYHSGKMSALEMHALEKAAMEDPFLADALEGYQHSVSPSEELKNLQTQLQSKIEKGKVVPLKKINSNQFLRIAALFILLAGCGWAVYQFGFNTNNNEIAAAKKTEAPAVVPGVATDTNSLSTVQSSATVTDSNKQITTIKETANGAVSISTQNRHTGKLNDVVVSDQKEQARKSEPIEQSETQIEDGAIASSSTEARMRGYRDTNSDTLRYNQQTVTPGQDNVIVMQRSQTAPMPEVVLNAKKRDSTYRKPHVTFEETEPASGSINYDDYVAANLQMPEEQMKKNIAGEVKLSFDVNDAGEAVNITVEKSLCAECDKEAIRLLKEGPKLVKKKKNTKGKLRILF